MKVILHAGMPKCGSSAIQTLLSSKPRFKMKDSNEENFLYCAINSKGEFLYGEKLVSEASLDSANYKASAAAKVIGRLEDSKKEAVVKKIEELSEQYDVLILSREEWGMNPEQVKKAFSFLDKGWISVEVLFFIRPQVEWINSAWWQWGAWGKNNKFEDWLNIILEKLSWKKFYEGFRSIPWVEKVNMKVMGDDVVKDFCDITGLEYVKAEKRNKSLPGSILRVFQHYPQLRPSSHASAIDFVLANRMELPKEPTPWVISSENIIKILDSYKEENDYLFKVLDPECQKLMEENSSWYYLSAFSDMSYENPENVDLTEGQLEFLLASALESIFKMDRSLSRKGE